MRKVIDLQRPLGSVPIEDIELDAKSRDDIPTVLIGLQEIYKDKAAGGGACAKPLENCLWRGPGALRRRFKPRSGPEAAGTRQLRTAGSLPKREKPGFSARRQSRKISALL